MSPSALSWIFHSFFVLAVVFFIVYAILAPNKDVEKNPKIVILVLAIVCLLISVGFIIWYYTKKNKMKGVSSSMTNFKLPSMSMNYS
jgi:hypothetical protein